MRCGAAFKLRCFRLGRPMTDCWPLRQCATVIESVMLQQGAKFALSYNNLHAHFCASYLSLFSLSPAAILQFSNSSRPLCVRRSSFQLANNQLACQTGDHSLAHWAAAPMDRPRGRVRELDKMKCSRPAARAKAATIGPIHLAQERVVSGTSSPQRFFSFL